MPKKLPKIVFIVCVFLLLSMVVINKFRTNNKTVPATQSKQAAICNDCNIIIIAYDALQAEHISHLGHDRQTTPMIDSIAKNGVSFENNISAAPWTVPSYMSIFTGLYPTEHKVVNKYTVFTAKDQTISNLSKLSPNVRTLAQELKSLGYVTGGFTGDAGVGSVFGYNIGFDTYFDGATFGSIGTAGEKAIEWLKNNQGKKFFMFLHGYDAHGQFNVPDNYQGEFFKGSDKYKINPVRQAELRELGLKQGYVSISPEEIQLWRDWYDSKIKDEDNRVADIWKELDGLGALKNTIVIVISDHGTEFMEHNKFDHGHSLYEELVRVPLVISAPNLPKDKIIDIQVTTLDIAPTIFGLIGEKPDSQFQSQIKGRSLIPLITEVDLQARDIYIETDYRDFTHKRGIRTPDGWKLIVTMETGQKELYNLQTDPTEQKNLIEEEPHKVFDLEIKLKQHLKDMGDEYDKTWTTGCLPVYASQCK